MLAENGTEHHERQPRMAVGENERRWRCILVVSFLSRETQRRDKVSRWFKHPARKTPGYAVNGPGWWAAICIGPCGIIHLWLARCRCTAVERINRGETMGSRAKGVVRYRLSVQYTQRLTNLRTGHVQRERCGRGRDCRAREAALSRVDEARARVWTVAYVIQSSLLLVAVFDALYNVPSSPAPLPLPPSSKSPFCVAHDAHKAPGQ
ncbi:hypothetical protein C8Q77DRAFT_225703 [Trametes polyzona]|nr:hypothetical protein C8Q77DRAFT_225703 [Trametes polyzona]